jgi:hypothetical protein
MRAVGSNLLRLLGGQSRMAPAETSLSTIAKRAVEKNYMHGPPDGFTWEPFFLTSYTRLIFHPEHQTIFGLALNPGNAPPPVAVPRGGYRNRAR